MGCCFSRVKTREQAPYPSDGRPYFNDINLLLLPSVSCEEKQNLISHNAEEEFSSPNNDKRINANWNCTEKVKGTPNLNSLSKEERKKLSEKWIQMGRAEHASVASFSLFAQRLLAIGAPPELIVEAFDCAKEEIEHAKYCFTLASHYAGYKIEPNVYQPHSVSIVPDIKAIVEATIQEGCIEETLSAMATALEFIEQDDPFVQDVYFKITKDEAHHAAFAWKFFKWALCTSPSYFDHYLASFDKYVGDLRGDKQTKIDLALLKELKEILVQPSLTPSEILQSYLHLDQSDRFYLYSDVISQIYDVITK